VQVTIIRTGSWDKALPVILKCTGYQSPTLKSHQIIPAGTDRLVLEFTASYPDDRRFHTYNSKIAVKPTSRYSAEPQSSSVRIQAAGMYYYPYDYGGYDDYLILEANFGGGEPVW